MLRSSLFNYICLVCLFFVLYNINSFNIKTYNTVQEIIVPEIIVQEAWKRGKLEEASTAYYREQHAISKLLGFVMSGIYQVSIGTEIVLNLLIGHYVGQ